MAADSDIEILQLISHGISLIYTQKQMNIQDNVGQDNLLKFWKWGPSLGSISSARIYFSVEVELWFLVTWEFSTAVFPFMSRYQYFQFFDTVIKLGDFAMLLSTREKLSKFLSSQEVKLPAVLICEKLSLN